MPRQDPFVSARDLTISYRRGTATIDVVTNISFDLDTGQTLGLVGESGSGKSTVAGALLGSLRSTSFVSRGGIAVGGQDVFGLDPERLRQFRRTVVSLVPQNAGSALTPTMKIGEQLREALPADLRDPQRQRARCAELLELVRVPGAAAALDRYPHEFSGGQQQRIGIAMAMAPGPALLVLDEPTTGLDVVTQAAILDLLADLQRSENLSMVMVSHDLGVIDAMCENVVVLRLGEIVETGPTASVLRAPSEPYTRALVASVPRIDRPGIPPSLDVTAGGAAAAVPTDAPPLPFTVRQPPVDPTPVLEVTDLTIDYRRRHIPETGPTVEGVTFTVHAGEIVALVGESGSGKSSIATAIAGLRRPDGGSIRLGDGPPLAPVIAKRSKGLRQKIQLIFQNADTSLNPRKSVGSIVARPIQLFGLADLTVAGALADVELPSSYAQRLPGQLSGGERQRVGIARAIAAGPALVLADEIVSALDVSVQSTILRLVDTLSRVKGLGFLFITHDLAVVRAIADRVVVLYLGRIVEEGTVHEVFSSITHPYTRLLLEAVIELGDAHEESRSRPDDEIPAAPPAVGCPYASRCPLVREACRTTAPPVIALSASHTIRCHADLDELKVGTALEPKESPALP